jgi:Ca-activated chloride channel family protein
MQYFAQIRAFAANALADWQTVRFGELQYAHREVRLWLLALIGVLLVLAIARFALGGRASRRKLVLPALPASIRAARASSLAHLPILLFLAGLLLFALALADPHSPFLTQEVTYPGRRIAVVVDASSSMRRGFINNAQKTQAVFYTTVEAAKRFVEQRVQGRYRDLMALVEFGNEAYVITPFTNDYDNILLSISLIGDPVEYSVFPDSGNTVIGQAVEQSVELFKAFDFLEASGNLLVIFTDGEDTHAVINGIPLDEIMRRAVDAHIPVYFVRANWGLGAGKMIADRLWMDAIAKTGGKFYAASDENTLQRAVQDINSVATGTISVRQYANQQSRFAMFAQAALLCWILAASLKLSVPFFQRLP